MEKSKGPAAQAISLSNLALRHLVEENQFLVNGFLNKIQSLDNRWIKIKVHTKELGDKNLIVTPNAFFISDVGLNARQNPGGFSAFLKKHIFNQRIISLKQYGLDRIVVFEFPEKFLVMELFAKGNLVLCDSEMTILMAMRREEWKDRKLDKGEKYKFPSSKGANPLDMAKKDFAAKLSGSGKSFFGATVEMLNVSPAIVEGVFEEQKLDKKSNACDASEKEVGAVLTSLKEIYSSKPGPAYLSEGVIYSAKTSKKAEKNFASVNAAVNELMLEDAASGKGKEELATEKEDIAKATSGRDKAKRDIDAKLRQIEALEKEETKLKEKGEKLFLHYQELKDLTAAISRAREKGIKEKEIEEKLQKASPILTKLKLSKDKLSIDL